MAELAARLRPLLTWAYRRRSLFPRAADLGAWAFGLIVGALLKLVFDVGRAVDDLLVLIVVAILLQWLLGTITGLYRQRWRVSSFDEVSAMATVWAITTVVLVVGNHAARQVGSDLNTSAVAMGAMVALASMSLVRGVWRRFWEHSLRPEVEGARRTIVFGAGVGGTQMVRSMLLDADSTYFPVALLDDDPAKAQRELDGVRVMGTRADLAEVAAATDADVLLIAIPSASSALISELADAAREVDLSLRVLPAASELVSNMTLADVRRPTVDDLLGRDPVEIDLDSIADYLRGNRVLITGAGGSIGAELSRQVRGFGPSELFLLDRDESALHGVQLSMEGHALLDSDMLIVADVRDRERMYEVFEQHRPQVVFHAAALKHLTLLQNHPDEGIKTNVVGTRNVLDAARAAGVTRFVNVSTDKAADPTSVLGATKLAAEYLTAEAAERTGQAYVSVRFGNVLGSRGSVLPTFMAQIEAGHPVTVTHPDVTRFFMTIPEAVRLVIQAGAIGGPGEVLVLDMGQPVRILDLAEQLIATMSPSTEIVFTGLRPGEKLHEVLSATDEVGVARDHPRIMHVPGAALDPALAFRALDAPAIAAFHRIVGGKRTGAGT